MIDLPMDGREAPKEPILNDEEDEELAQDQ